MTLVKIKNVLISCHNKTGLKYFASELVKLNPMVKIYSSGGTYRELKEAVGENLVEISSYTGFPEMPGGLVKTLHPKIHAGILAEIGDREQALYLEENGIVSFDLVVVNLYPFQEAVHAGNGFSHARKNIDIGGVSLLEASVKNFLRVAVVCDIQDYESILEILRSERGTEKDLRLTLAQKAATYLAAYLSAINNYFKGLSAHDIEK
jgi:phosphoribosylaminoimidazolecarboxamide formyltransferase / IMP cyclohydrolase